MPHILVVEDEPVYRLWMGLVFKAVGYEAIAVEDGVAAWNLLSNNAQFDLVITDLLMPNMDGAELIEHISQNLPYLSVMMITAYAYLFPELIQAGLYPVLLKPVSHQTLVNTAKQLVNGP